MRLLNFKNGSALIIVLLVLGQFLPGCKNNKPTAQGWTAPPEADQLFNPLINQMVAEQKGRELYVVYCRSCHGENGYGDGAAGNALGQKPANFHDEKMRKQRQGAIFWKISNGNGMMPPFKESLSDEQRWQLVSYIRSLTNKAEAAVVPPRALRPDIKISHYKTIGPLAVRILKHPVTNVLYYTTFDGDVFQLRQQKDSTIDSVRIISLADHGINRLQGAEFFKNSLFLCGNVDSDDKKSTSGRMVVINLDSTDTPRVRVVFNTVKYGANKTIYDHGWNALALSPDGKYIYANSGARTDHGEVQDNGGLYPNARDNALTGKIFRFPVGARDLMLTDDEAKLNADSLIYAEGIRNAYDMAFDGKGHLFAVVNSSDYDSPEDMFWIRQGHHFGFPWIMGGVENPQQFPDWNPDPATDSFINKFSHSWQVRYFHRDSSFPKLPPGVKISAGVQNVGPDANEYRGHSGRVMDGDTTGVAVSTFTPHASPLGIFFDTHGALSSDLHNDGFVIRYSFGARDAMMGKFTKEGADMLHLQLSYDSIMNNFMVRTTRIVDGFAEPTDAVLIGNDVYVIEYGGRKGEIWKISLPGKPVTAGRKTSASKPAH